MTTTTDLAQALRELLDSHDHVVECDYVDQRAADERECAARIAARELLAAHERAQANVPDTSMLRRCWQSLEVLKGSAHKFGEVYDSPNGGFVRWEDVERFLSALPQPPAQPASVPDPDWLANLRHELRMSKITHNFTLTRDELAYILGDPLLAPMPAQPASVAEHPLPMETAPRDGTMVRLLVDFTEHATEDTAGPAWTIGANNDDNVCDDERVGWLFAGWCWTHDHFTQGEGTPVGWLPMLAAAPQPPAKESE